MTFFLLTRVLPVSTYMGVTSQYHKGDIKSTPTADPDWRRIKPMKPQVLRWLRVSLGLLLFAVGGGQPGGFDLVAQQIQVRGAGQWLGLMAGSAIGPVSQHIAGALPRHQP